MPVEWVKVGTSVAIGGAAGAVDQLVQNQDEKREAAKGEKLGIMTQYGTYYNYGIPILAILGTAFGFLKGDMATRLVTAGSQLAGRKITHQVTKKAPAAWTAWSRDKAAAAQRAREMAARAQQGAGATAAVGIEF